jgi:hypothetical protein
VERKNRLRSRNTQRRDDRIGLAIDLPQAIA